jgi:hypothetical protein
MSITRKAQIIETISVEKLFEALEPFKKVKTISEELELYNSTGDFIKRESLEKKIITYFFPKIDCEYSEEEICDLLDFKNIYTSDNSEDFECPVLEVANYNDYQSKEIDFDLFKFSRINDVLRELGVPKVDTIFKLKLYQE